MAAMVSKSTSATAITELKLLPYSILSKKMP